MIIKNFNKNLIETFNYHTIPHIDIILVNNYLIKAYISFIKLSYNYKQILIVNNDYYLNSFIENLSLEINLHYLNNKWIPGMLTNWVYIKHEILLLNWILKIFKISILNKLVVSKKINSKLYNLYIKLKLKFWGLLTLKNLPDFVFILNVKVNQLALKEIFIQKKSIICISNNIELLNKSTIPIYGIYNNNLIYIILYLIYIAYKFNNKNLLLLNNSI